MASEDPAPVFLAAWRRSPWVRHAGAAAAPALHPVDLLASVLEALTSGDDPPDPPGLLIAGCATPVGAQSGNIARNAALAAGWPETVPASTIDGGQAASLLALGHAVAAVRAGQTGRAVAAGVEATSIVPRGAATVRDYGRPPGPRLDQRLGGFRPELALAEDLAAALASSPLSRAATGRALLGDGAYILATGVAADADGAAAVTVVGASAADSVRVGAVASAGGSPVDLTGATVAVARIVLDRAGLSPPDLGTVFVTDHLAVVVAAVVDQLDLRSRADGRGHGPSDEAAWTLHHGTAPGADGLGAVVDAADLVIATGRPALVLGRGPLGVAAGIVLLP